MPYITSKEWEAFRDCLVQFDIRLDQHSEAIAKSDSHSANRVVNKCFEMQCLIADLLNTMKGGV